MTSSTKPEVGLHNTMPSEEDRATATVSMHRKFGGVRSYSFRDMQADRQTDRQTDIHTHHNTAHPRGAKWKRCKRS